MKIRRLAAFLALSIPLAACVSSSDSTTPSPNPNAGFQARFTPLGGIMPFPNDLYFGADSTGQLNIPGSTTVAQNGPLLEMNHLDGFGTQSDISIYFTEAVNASTLPTGVLVFQVTSDFATKAVTGFVRPLIPGTDYSIGLSPGIDSAGQIVTIKPLKPLVASTFAADGVTPVPSTYLVIVTRGVTNASGTPVSPSADYSAIVAADTPALATLDVTKIAMTATDPLLPVAEFTLPQLAVAAGAGVTPDKVAITFSFSTQYLNVSLALLAAKAKPTAQPAGTGIFDTTKTVCDILVLSKKLPNAAACAAAPGSTATEVYAGDLALPYYLTVPKTGATTALTDSWHNAKGGDIALSALGAAGFMPRATAKQNVIPVVVTIPTGAGCAMPLTGWPIVIFQHGITRSREDVFGIASGFGQSCVAVIAIDLPLHGVTDVTDPFYKNQLFTGTPAAAALTAAVSERTFDMDATGAAGATGSSIGGSGAQFINLNSTITSRDNLREGAADLINLVNTLSNLHPVGAAINAFDTSKVYFVGHSLGGIIGTTFLGADSLAPIQGGTSKIVSATLAMPGGHIAELLRNSPSFEPIIDAGLAQQGLVKGSQSYYDFYSEAQAVVEDGDPANYAAYAANGIGPLPGHPIHMIEVVGDGTSSHLPDQVVPNSATVTLAAAMGLSLITATAVNPAGVHGLVQFTAGDHGSILDPTTSLAATTEMQTETVVFAAGNPLVPLPGDGQVILVQDLSVVKH